MKCFALVSPGLEKVSRQEVRELLKVKAEASDSVVEFSVRGKKDLLAKDLLTLIFHSQSLRRILLSLGKFRTADEISFDALEFPWREYFPETFSFKVEVEGVKGQENRWELAKTVAGKLFPLLEKNGLKPSLELKKPDFLVGLFFNGRDYFAGLDLAGKELNARSYRLFAHQASMKGDLAYYFVRSSKFKVGEKLLVGFAKDGTLAIEAALFANRLAVQKSKDNFSLRKCPLFRDLADFDNRQQFPGKIFPGQKEPINISAFDENRTSITAARKNSQLAGVKERVDFQKYALDELDTRFGKEEFDRLLFHLTKKDEDQINEIYHQADYVLKPKGTLLLLTSARLELSAPSRFILKKREEIRKGDNLYQSWLMQKKVITKSH